MPDAPAKPANGVLAALSGSTWRLDSRRREEALLVRDREVRALLAAALRKLEEGPP